MKKIFYAIAFVLFVSGAQGQTTFTVDSVGMNALILEGGMTQVRFADINQDGNLDVITIGDHGSPTITNQHGITVFFGDGLGGWTLFQNGNFGYGGVAVGDLNNDGKQDVAYSMHHNTGSADFGDQLIEAALGDGTGLNWTPWDDQLGGYGETYGMFGTDLGDIDNDGFLDIGSNSFGLGPGVHIYKNLGTGTWTQSFAAGDHGTTGHYIQFGDINHDGNLDFVISNEFGSPYFGDGLGNFTAVQSNDLPALSNSYNYRDVGLGDMDNDGADDFTFVYNPNAGTYYGVYVYKWNMITSKWDDHSTGLPTPADGYYYLLSRLADVDMDGFMDVVTVRSLLGTAACDWHGDLEIWKGNGGVSWTKMYSYSLPKLQACQDLAIGDFNNNGYPDILFWGTYSTGGIFCSDKINKIKLFVNDSVPATLKITNIYPKGYECFPNNAARFIDWVSAVPNNHASMVKIELSTTGATGPWTLVKDSLPNNGRYQWTVPASVNSGNCHFRFTVTDKVTLLTAVSITANSFDVGTCVFNVGVHDVLATNDVKVFPNPFHASATISSSKKNCSVKILDMTGNLVRAVSEVKQFPYVINRENLSAGIYLLELSSSDGSVSRQKLVIN